MSTFESLFTKDTADLCALEIVTSLDSKITQLDYDFHINDGVFTSNSVNTWIRFDSEPNSTIREILTVLTDETIEATKERILIFDNFRKEVANIIETTYRDLLAKKLRKEVFSNKLGTDVLPLKTIKVLNIDISDVPASASSILVVDKLSPKDSVPQGVSKDIYMYLQSIDEEIKNDPSIRAIDKVNEYIKEQKRIGNSAFTYVKCARLKKAFFECQVDLYIDYTILKD